MRAALVQPESNKFQWHFLSTSLTETLVCFLLEIVYWFFWTRGPFLKNLIILPMPTCDTILFDKIFNMVSIESDSQAAF